MKLPIVLILYFLLSNAGTSSNRDYECKILLGSDMDENHQLLTNQDLQDTSYRLANIRIEVICKSDLLEFQRKKNKRLLEHLRGELELTQLTEVCEMRRRQGAASPKRATPRLLYIDSQILKLP